MYYAHLSLESSMNNIAFCAAYHTSIIFVIYIEYINPLTAGVAYIRVFIFY